MGPFDGSIVNSMLPVLTREFQVDIATTQWILTIYMLIQSGLMLSFGRLGDLRGHKLVYASGLVVFMLGAFLCSLAPTPMLLIAARAVTALGSSAMWSNSAAILTHSFPSAQRGRALGLQSMMVQLGASCGPPVGGLLVGALGWRAIFWVSIPLAAIALVLCLRFIQRDQPSGRGERFDLAGATLYLLGQLAGNLDTALMPDLSLDGWQSAVLWAVPVVACLIATMTARRTVVAALRRMP